MQIKSTLIQEYYLPLFLFHLKSKLENRNYSSMEENTMGKYFLPTHCSILTITHGGPLKVTQKSSYHN